jgi:nucleoside-diphosphate-sugar epimerase
MIAYPQVAAHRERAEAHRSLDVSRARERIGFDAAVGLEEGLERTVESFRAETLPAPASI